MMACAVPSASLPMRKTAVLPLRRTPAASASTFGRPSKTKPTTPSGAATCSTVQPVWTMRSTTRPRNVSLSRHARRPRSCPAASDRWRRAGSSNGHCPGALDILPVRLGDGTPSRRIFEERSETVEEPLDGPIRYGRHRHEGGMRPVHRGGSGQGDLSRGDVEQVSGLLQDQQMIAGLEGLREFRVITVRRSPPKGTGVPDTRRAMVVVHGSGHRAISVLKPSRAVVESDHPFERCADGRRDKGFSAAPEGSGRRDEHGVRITIPGRR